MPYLDSLTGKLNNNITSIMVTRQKHEKVEAFLTKKQIKFEHMLLQNNMDNFILSLCMQ
jgi:hypothetical protein